MARAFCLLVISTLLFGGEEFIFWAKYLSSNSLIKYQNISISKAMVLSKEKGSKICDIQSSKFNNETTLNYLKRHQEQLFECFINQKVLLKDSSKFKGNSANLKTSVTLVPVRFIVEFKPLGATISKINR
ncbi:hypothetical protein [Campylobacter fetus]|uniref:hypothetical protein n=1 Tax=Campylobacter fetus TaxID=196 RepID=UPI00288EB5E6|nr:hypothetical protein [Campylobacter fetus subsp. venerealis]